MKIQQFEDKSLAHYSYAILSECSSQIILIDPSRKIDEYLEFARSYQAKIIGVIETHPHADFISGHLEIHAVTGATIYCSKYTGATYPHDPFDEGNSIMLGKIRLSCLNTPGHSPDSITIVLEHEGVTKAVFSGDTLFIGDCGRPDLREQAGNIRAKREELASQMFHSLRHKLMTLGNEVILYPAHGAGTLCGKALSEASQSTLGAEKISNWSLQAMSENDFIAELTRDQPFIPKYFPYDVDLNKLGAPILQAALSSVPFFTETNGAVDARLSEIKGLTIDTRPAEEYRKGHRPYAINLMDGGKFETWLGSIVSPYEKFNLIATDESSLRTLVERTAKIGYESFITQAVVSSGGPQVSDILDLAVFRKNPELFTIVDVRNNAEVNEHPIFNHSLHIPLSELRERAGEIPLDKPVVVHCASGYRSAAGSSVVAAYMNGQTPVFDLSDAIKEYDQV